MEKYKLVVELLGFLTATRDYSFVDRVGNSLNSIVVAEAIRDALRAYVSLCIHGMDKNVKISENQYIQCPELDPVKLEAQVNEFLNSIMELPSGKLVEITRDLAARSLSASLKYRPISRGETQ